MFVHLLLLQTLTLTTEEHTSTAEWMLQTGSVTVKCSATTVNNFGLGNSAGTFNHYTGLTWQFSLEKYQKRT